jgi:Asp-tRNA(Asn)/Glu-tRNA(Gln) amidotransferase A subunit family amidase
LEGCKLFIKSIIAGQPWLREPSLLPLPWKEEDAFKGRKLKIAVLWDDGVVKPHPPVTRAMKKVVEELKAKGHEVVDWTPYKHDEAWAIIVSPVPHLSDPQADSARQTSISAMALPRTWPS